MMNVRFREGVLEQITSSMMEGFRQYPWGGVEKGGLLIGTRDGDAIEVREYIEVFCEHHLGPSFELTDEERSGITLPPEVVGWIHSVSYREPALSESDRALFDAWCPQPWQVAIVVKRAKNAEPVMVGFVRGGSANVVREATRPVAKAEATPDVEVLPKPAAPVDAVAEPERVVQPPAEPVRVMQPAAEPERVVEPPAEPVRVMQPAIEPERVVQPPAEPLVEAAPEPVVAASQREPEGERAAEPVVKAAPEPEPSPNRALQPASPPDPQPKSVPVQVEAAPPAPRTPAEPAPVPVRVVDIAPVVEVLPPPGRQEERNVREAFGLTPDPDFFYPSPLHTQALGGLEYAVRDRKGFALLTGESGLGKTMLVECLTDDFRKHDVEYAFLFNPKLTSEQFYELLGYEFNLDAKGKSAVMIAMNEFLTERAAEGKVTALVIDDAQKLSVELLEEIELLGNLETRKGKLMQVVFAGRPEFEVMLDREQLRGLKSRVLVRTRLKPLSEKETGAYIEWRLARSGRQKHRLTDEVPRIYQVSKGVPRLINAVCSGLLKGRPLESITEELGVGTPQS